MQQINLYQAQFKPKQVLLPAKQLYLIATLPIILFLAISVYLSNNQASFSDSIAIQSEQLQPLKQQLSELQLKVNSRKENPLLLAELTQFRTQLVAKQTLLAHLDSQKQSNQFSFSSMLEALSQQHIKNMWLTRFSLLDSGNFIAIQGSAFNAELVPEYIDSLAKSEQFNGKQFSVFQLQQQDKSEYFDFKLHTKQSQAQP